MATRPRVWLAGLLVGCSGSAAALDFDAGGFSGRLNTRIAIGGAWRTEDPDSRFIAKQNLNPDLCGPSNCQSFTGDPSENQKLVDAPGAFFGTNKDDGNLNYRRWDTVAAVSRLGAELSGSWNERLRFELAGFAYYDPVNEDFDERHVDTTFQPARTPRVRHTETDLGRKLQLKRALVATDFSLADQIGRASCRERVS
jgi:hypothetical protein